ncbi:3-oxoacyl-[acyl-carrier protein] reductase [Geosporobacter subterraneus DSM 17957]|uniref:3-oxoacyl-[acyl-carrier protein] reductase n=1 Tax=Geosporobacter subterraneus DSM 17957 TaxID=1121919 RepID=A0A1M6K5N3_9FIRM|nr:SDR family NAD(P)-dependent oxidoreductase [Geosporobacter subterraneus]SHJ54296.1 3-oxoacyl-[acyl-carrier protein] reductase [Geosporobacter subterraneus DSM 17957]
MIHSISDKSIIVTGAGKGIGSAVAQHLASLGSKVCIADIDLTAAQETVKRIITANGNGIAVYCNITSPSDVEKMVEEVLRAYGRIDVLINNAGFFPIKTFEAMSFDDWKKVIDINLTGTFCVTQPVYLQMKKQGYGKIINITSAAGRIGGVGFVHYSAAKSGVIGLTRALAREGASSGIQVNAVAPGLIETGTAKSVFPAFALKEFVRNVPMGRLGREEDLTGMISFLCSDGSNYITGQVFAVDGGYTMI